MKKAVVAVFAVLLLFAFITFTNAQDPGMMGQKAGSRISSDNSAGAKIFDDLCKRCHPGGGNIIVPSLPLKSSGKLSDFKTFLAFIRNPGMPDGSEGIMPRFSKRQVSDREAKRLYQYVAGTQTSGGYRGGYGMGPGMMGGYGMGPGMMGGYQSEECQKFLDDTAKLRKELHNKRFEYSEAYRNPKTTQETLLKLDKEIFDLQNKIYSASPLGCRW